MKSLKGSYGASFVRLTFLALLVGFGLTAPCLAMAEVTYDITMNTGSLAGSTAALTFDFIDGGAPDNGISISNFSTDGILGEASSTGSVNGSVGTGLTLSDASFFNEEQQVITLGSTVSFQLDATTNLPAAGSLPDTFSLFLLDPTGTNSLTSTTDPTGADSLLTFQISDVTDTAGDVVGQINVYDSSPSIPITATLRTLSPVGAPEIDSASAASALTLLWGGIAVLRGRRRSSRRPLTHPSPGTQPRRGPISMRDAVQARWILIVLTLGAAIPWPAWATFPGANGQIAYEDGPNATGEVGQTGIFGTSAGQLTFPVNRGSQPIDDLDTYPAWSPDGSQLAFVRLDQTQTLYSIMIVKQDGSNPRTVIQSTAFGGGPGQLFFYMLAWAPDGQRISFITVNREQQHNLWTVKTDGSALTLVDQFYAQWYPNWSSLGELVYTCAFRTDPVFSTQFDDDICYVDANGVLHQIAVTLDPPYTRFPSQTLYPKWSPAGDRILITASYYVTNGGHTVSHSELFWLNKTDATLTQITDSADLCPLSNSGAPAFQYYAAAPSPDGQTIVVAGRENGTSSPTCSQEPLVARGLWTVSAQGGAPTLMIPTPLASALSPDWQPLPQGLTFNLEDGHGNPLKGLKVQLLRSDLSLIDGQPINTVGGSYVFQDALAPGDYVLEATLIDQCAGEGCTPSFDVQYGPGPSGSVWTQFKFHVQTSAQASTYSFAFSADEPAFLNTSIDLSDASLLSDMANIYFRTRQYVDWLQARITPNTGSTVHYLTYSTVDPDGNALPTDKSYSAYFDGISSVIFNARESDYEARDGIPDADHDNDAPENGEWHEFTHHIYATFIGQNCSTADQDHLGWYNPNTCISMDEGFATFLPTLAGQDILGTSSTWYANMFDIASPTKAWGYVDGSNVGEDYAVASLLWDLVKVNPNPQPGQIIGSNGVELPVIYNETVLVPLSTLWAQMTALPAQTANTATVAALRNSFGSQALTIDLDGDYVNDVAPVDVPFLRHGFYPVDTDQAANPSATTYPYDLRYAQAHGITSRDGVVGQSAHYVFQNDVAIETYIPRSNIPSAPNAKVNVAVLDTAGTPIPGATINLTLSYPDGHQSTLSVPSGGDINPVQLVLPPYFDYSLPEGAPLPTCNPATDYMITVTLSAQLSGMTSTTTPTFDNCAYLQAIRAGTGPAALSYTLTLPIAPTTFTVGGTVTGLAGATLILLNNGAAPIAVSADGSFSFTTPLTAGAAYSVTAASQPIGRNCTVADGSGTIGSSNVTSVVVTCMPAQQDITTSLTVAASGLVLNRSTNTFNFTVTLTNISTVTFKGPIWLLVSGLPSGTSLATSGAVTSAGVPYIVLMAPGNQLAPGASITQLVAVSDPGRVALAPKLSVWGIAPE